MKIYIVLFQIFMTFLVYSNSYAGFKFGLTNAIKDAQEKLDDEYRSIPPTVSITNPADGSVVSGTVSVTAVAVHHAGISKVEFYIDDTLKDTDTSSPYSYSWDTTLYNDGSHTLKVIAYDIVNQPAISQHSITVDNTVPAVSITNPEAGSKSSGTVIITADAGDDSGISKVEFYIDGNLKFTDNSSPYSWNWNTTQESEGSHTVKVTAYDTLNQTASAQHTVTVDNVAAPTVSITNPDDGSTVAAAVNVTALASGEAVISKVEFYIDGDLKSTDTSSPYSYPWDTTQYIDGSHTVKVIAHDAENQTVTHQITVTVDNVPADGEWRIIDDDLVIVGIGDNSYLMWPRPLNCAGTNDNKDTLNWASGPYPQPTWISTKTAYDYPGEYSADNYPAFKWAEELEYKGYDDWRLPKVVELEELWDVRDSYIGYNLFYYWSSEENPSFSDLAYAVRFNLGNTLSIPKTGEAYVRAVRESQTGGNSPPSISITNPVAGPISSGTVVVTVDAYDDYGISRVEFYIDDVIKSTKTTSPYSWIWDTTQGDDGPRAVKAIIYDISNQTASDQVTVSVDNTPPTAYLTYPPNGSTSSGTVIVTAYAWDANGIDKVEFYINGVIKSTVTSLPYEYSWDTTRSTDGVHAVKVIAYDTTRHTESETSTVTVNNWQTLYDDLVKSYTKEGNYLMWPSSKICLGTNNDGALNWASAMSWAADLEYKGHSDWRLPTKNELKDLYESGRFYIDYNPVGHWSSTEDNGNAYRVDFTDGVDVSADKNNLNKVRAVRDSQGDEAPIVFISTPSAGSTSSGTVVVSVDAYDDYEISKVDFYINGIATFTDTSLPYNWDWDTTYYSDGTKTIKAIIYDNLTQTATNQHTVTVDNTPPEVSISTPTAGSTVTATVNIIAVATDTVVISKVVFYIDGVPKSTDTSSPYEYSWDTTQSSDSLRTIKVIAYDNIYQTISTRTVWVDNWEIMADTDLVKVCTSSYTYLIWPRDKTSTGCFKNGIIQWSTAVPSGQPVWNSGNKCYDYPSGDYPAFEWADNLTWKGKDDWRLPTKDELKDLYDYGRFYITSADSFYWSSTMASDTEADGVVFNTGDEDDRDKIVNYYIRAVHDE